MRKLRIEEKIAITLNLSWELFLKTSDSDAQDLIADRDGGQSKEGWREERRKSGKTNIGLGLDSTGTRSGTTMGQD